MEDLFRPFALAILAVFVTRSLYKAVKPFADRASGESLAERVQQFQDQQHAKSHAIRTMFGSVPTTVSAFVAIILVEVGIMYGMVNGHEQMAAAALVYLVLGLVLTARFAQAARSAGYQLLPMSLKITHRLVYASVWPIIFLLWNRK